jgi:hypothetical protein
MKVRCALPSRSRRRAPSELICTETKADALGTLTAMTARAVAADVAAIDQDDRLNP